MPTQPKTRANDASVDAFLLANAGPDRLGDCQVLVGLMQRITGEPPRMWGDSIVGFGAYRYRYESGREGQWPLAAFSPRKQDLTVYLMAGFDRHADLLARLGRHRNGRSCLHLRRLADVDLTVLDRLVQASVDSLAGRRVMP
ncbi:MAG: DUF1801 domain-containing protein [Rubrivivax sp.]|nr:DUF1801 domain-containing protein [Rubrivivax sp.]